MVLIPVDALPQHNLGVIPYGAGVEVDAELFVNVQCQSVSLVSPRTVSRGSEVWKRKETKRTCARSLVQNQIPLGLIKPLLRGLGVGAVLDG